MNTDAEGARRIERTRAISDRLDAALLRQLEEGPHLDRSTWLLMLQGAAAMAAAMVVATVFVALLLKLLKFLL